MILHHHDAMYDGLGHRRIVPRPATRRQRRNPPNGGREFKNPPNGAGEWLDELSFRVALWRAFRFPTGLFRDRSQLSLRVTYLLG
jgi:hypothetical protein